MDEPGPSSHTEPAINLTISFLWDKLTSLGKISVVFNKFVEIEKHLINIKT